MDFTSKETLRRQAYYNSLPEGDPRRGLARDRLQDSIDADRAAALALLEPVDFTFPVVYTPIS